MIETILLVLCCTFGAWQGWLVGAAYAYARDPQVKSVRFGIIPGIIAVALLVVQIIIR